MEWNCELLSELGEPSARSGITLAITYYPRPRGQLTQEAASSKQSGLINSEVHHRLLSIMPECDAGLDPLPGASASSVLAWPVHAEWGHNLLVPFLPGCPADKKRLISCLIFSREKWLLICMSYWTRAPRNLPTQSREARDAMRPGWPETNGTICNN